MATTTERQGTHQWAVDSTHSSIDFSVRHMGVFTVRGTMGPLSGTGTSEDDKLASATLSIDVTGINTNNADRDTHIKTAEFLNVEAYPTINFVSTSIVSDGGTGYTISGDLTIAGHTQPITVNAEAVAPVTDPWGNFRAGLTGSGSLKRSEFGLTWNSVMETGHVMISDEVKFTFDIQAILVKE